jgi:hypothetical protein
MGALSWNARRIAVCRKLRSSEPMVAPGMHFLDREPLEIVEDAFFGKKLVKRGAMTA